MLLLVSWIHSSHHHGFPWMTKLRYCLKMKSDCQKNSQIQSHTLPDLLTVCRCTNIRRTVLGKVLVGINEVQQAIKPNKWIGSIKYINHSLHAHSITPRTWHIIVTHYNLPTPDFLIVRRRAYAYLSRIWLNTSVKQHHYAPPHQSVTKQTNKRILFELYSIRNALKIWILQRTVQLQKYKRLIRSLENS